MPIASTNDSIPIYATIDKSKKTKCRLVPEIDNKNQKTLFIDSLAVQANKKAGETDDINCTMYNRSANSLDNKDQQVSASERCVVTTNSQTYMNLEFAQSLEFYENSKDILSRTQFIHKNTDKKVSLTDNLVNQNVMLQNEVKYCKKCVHACNSAVPSRKQDDYLMMEPGNKKIISNDAEIKSHSGYIPMQPVPSGDRVSKGVLLECNFTNRTTLLSGRAASSPSLSLPALHSLKQGSEISLKESGCSVNQSVSASSSPYLHRKLLSNVGRCGNEVLNSTSSVQLRRRSNSVESARYIDDLESITEKTVSSSQTPVNGSKHTSIDSLCSQTFSIKRHNDTSLSNFSSFTNLPPCSGDALVMEKDIHIVPYNKTDKQYQMTNQFRYSLRDTVDPPVQAVHIRRSSSVPCKSGHNRDSSSSNDSGVSVGSLKQRGSDFAEFELPLTTSMSTRRHHHALNKEIFIGHANCFHASLPRRSKSSDILRELSFKFQDMKVVAKSSSAEAEIPICLKSDTKGML